MEFKEWWKRLQEGRYDQGLEAVHKTWAYIGWNAAIVHSDEIHELISKCKDLPSLTKEDPTPTEMVKRLLEKGWTIEQDTLKNMTLFDPFRNGYGYETIADAYRKAFPRKVKKDIKVWWCPHCNGVQCYDSIMSTQWSPVCRPIKGTATFYVDEE